MIKYWIRFGCLVGQRWAFLSSSIYQRIFISKKRRVKPWIGKCRNGRGGWIFNPRGSRQPCRPAFYPNRDSPFCFTFPPINLNFGQFIFRLETERSNALTNNSRFDLCDCLSRNLAHGLNIDSIFIDYRICQRFISDYAPLPIYTVRGITRIGKI